MAGQANNNKQQLKKKKLLRPNFNLSEERAPKACFVRYTFLFLIPETSSAQKEKKKTTKIKIGFTLYLKYEVHILFKGNQPDELGNMAKNNPLLVSQFRQMKVKYNVVIPLTVPQCQQPLFNRVFLLTFK